MSCVAAAAAQTEFHKGLMIVEALASGGLSQGAFTGPVGLDQRTYMPGHDQGKQFHRDHHSQPASRTSLFLSLSLV
ncbi:hypothetical protein M413DRAFT_205669 [Hebeloma cylindrosporum]|uniref:Uncharacterized protein n=1 Tax=Hebeloma cylindrosporum TaxID=76867 RepID=A0A0C2Z2Y2_HEBCY|nr:hypothetical protein M413DRAFT_205669 [Hebeloma cylindrosporum h7]